MKKIITYIKDNLMFVSIFMILIIIVGGLGVYSFSQKKPQEENPTPPQIDNPETETTFEITSFEGYVDKTNKVVLNWSIKDDARKITNVTLYHNDIKLAEVKGFSSYAFSQDIYRFPGGDNVFTIKVETKDEVKTKEASVFIDFIQERKVNMVETESGYDMQMTYRYDKNMDLGVPRILLINTQNQTCQYAYKDQTIYEEGNYAYVTTTYSIDTKDVKPGRYQMELRWIFESIGKSYDDVITIEKKEESIEVPADKPGEGQEETDQGPENQPDEEQK